MLPVGLLAGVANSVILVAILWFVLPQLRLIVWLSAVFVLAFSRYVLYRRYQKSSDWNRNALNWGRLLLIGNLLSGIVWGSLAIFAFPTESAVHQIFQAFVIGGMVAGAVGTYSISRLAFSLYAFPAVTPMIVRFLSFPDPIHLAMGLMSAIFLALMTSSVFRMAMSQKEGLRLEFENRRLVGNILDEARRAEEIAAELRRLTAHMDSVREEESKRIATEIHDHLGQALAVAKFELSNLELACRQSPQELQARIGSVSGVLDGVIEEIRRIARNLRPLVLDDLGLDAAVDWLVKDFRQRTQIQCALTILPGPDPLSPAFSITLFRILQEALANVARHSEAHNVDIALDYEGETISLTVRDDGKGLPEDFAGRDTFGVLSMRERAVRLGGELNVSSRQSAGTEVLVRIPKDNPAQKD